MAVAAQQQSIKSDQGDIPITLLSRNVGAKRPGVVVVPSIFGVADDLVATLSELAEQHAIVAVMDPFFRVQPGPIPYSDFGAALDRMKKVEMPKVLLDFTTICDWLRQHPASSGRIVGLGICFGGPFCLMAAAAERVDGVVTWHGSRMHDFVDNAERMRCPMAFHFGAEDSVVPLDKVAIVKAAFAERDDVQIVVHAGAGHGFSHQGASYQQAAADAGIEALREMLARVS